MSCSAQWRSQCKGAESPGPTFRPESSPMAPCSISSSSTRPAPADFRRGSSGSTARCSEGGRRIAATRVADCSSARPWRKPIDHRQYRFPGKRSLPQRRHILGRHRRLPPGSESSARELSARATPAPRGCGHTHRDRRCFVSLTVAEEDHLNVRYNYLIAMDRLELPWESARRRRFWRTSVTSPHF